MSMMIQRSSTIERSSTGVALRRCMRHRYLQDNSIKFPEWFLLKTKAKVSFPLFAMVPFLVVIERQHDLSYPREWSIYNVCEFLV